MANSNKTEKKKSKTEAMFEAYATNLRFYKPEYIDIFCCPICFRLLDRQALVDREITIEHIIPSSLGGKTLTLTCKECNSRDGSNLDAHLKLKLDKADILTGKVHAPLRSTVFSGAGKQTADVYFFDKQGKFAVHIDGKPLQTDPEMQQKFVEALNSCGQEIRVRSSLEYNELSTQVAKIRIAYLLMFRHFGYGYIRHPNLDAIRSLIVNPDPTSPFLNGIVNFEVPPALDFIGVISSPVKLRSFLSVFTLSTATDRYSGVLLPGCDTRIDELYGELSKKSTDRSAPVDITINRVDYRREYVTDSEYMNFPCHIWNRPT